MKFAHALQLAGVPQELHASALASLEKAQKASRGTTLAVVMLGLSIQYNN